MTQKKSHAEKIAELNALFLTLDDRGQDSALTIVKSLEFAQSVTNPPEHAGHGGVGGWASQKKDLVK